MHDPAKSLVERFRDDNRGVAVVEFALIAIIVLAALANAVDFGLYEWRFAQVGNAAEDGGQTAWKTCAKSGLLPATVNCPGLTSAVTTAIQSTELGTRVALASGSPSEGYYCLSTQGGTAGTLQPVGSLNSEPTDCSSVGSANEKPGDYIIVKVATPYAPTFPGLSLMSTWGPASITATSWVRLQ
jgi:Flp pilus assembly protein TadG